MIIIVDCFGGDHAPLEILKGCSYAIKEYDLDVLLTGDKDIINSICKEYNISMNRMNIVHTTEVISIEDDPLNIIKSKSNSSMAVGLKLLSEGKGDAFLSAGSTGALVVGGNFIIKRIKGIKRASLAPIIPNDNGCYILLDAGANIECRPEMIFQFAIMGDIYMKKILHLSDPKVGLVNIGEEPSKGGDLQIQSYSLLENGNFNFIGNIEPRDIPLGRAEIIVCDGFTGNVILKLTEGLGKSIAYILKNIFYSNWITKIAAILVKNKLDYFKSKMDYTEYGGAPLLGLRKPVIKAHGSSNAKAIKNAIKQAKEFVDKNVIKEIESSI